MSTVIKELIAKFTADTSDIEGGSKKAASAISGFSKAAVTAAAATSAAFAVLAVRQARVGDELGKLTDKYGVSTEAISRYSHAADLAGVSSNELANSFRFMQGSLVDAISGSEQAQEAYTRLGLSARQLIDMKPEEAFERIADALSRVENPAQRSALAIDIFGRAGANMLPMLKEGAAGLAKISEEADRFGLTISRADASKLEAANDAVSRLGAAANGAARQFAVGLAPAVSTALEKMLRMIDAADGFNAAGKVMGLAMAMSLDRISNSIDALIIKWQKLKIAADNVLFTDSAASTLRRSGMEAELNRLETNLALKKSGASSSFLKDFLTESSKSEKSASSSSPVANISLTAKQAKDAIDEFNKYTDEAIRKQQELGNAVADTAIDIKNGFTQGGSVLRNFGNIALNVLNDIANNMLRVSLGGSAGGGIGGILAKGIMGGFGVGNVTRGYLNMSASDAFGKINWNADGGVIQGRSVFPSAGGMQGAGENGAEGILPLKRVNGKLGVATDGGGSVNQTIVINAGVSQTVRAEILRLLPQIRQEAVRAVSENNYRGITP